MKAKLLLVILDFSHLPRSNIFSFSFRETERVLAYACYKDAALSSKESKNKKAEEL